MWKDWGRERSACTGISEKVKGSVNNEQLGGLGKRRVSARGYLGRWKKAWTMDIWRTGEEKGERAGISAKVEGSVDYTLMGELVNGLKTNVNYKTLKFFFVTRKTNPSGPL